MFMKICSIQPNLRTDTITKSSCTNNYPKCLSFQSNEATQAQARKKNKVKECFVDICIGWVAWDIIKELYHFFSNKGKPPFP